MPVDSTTPLRNVGRLRRVGKQLRIWDELDAQALLPTQRRWVPVPALYRTQLKSLQAELVAALADIEAGRPLGEAARKRPGGT